MKNYSFLKYSWLVPIIGIAIALIVLLSSCDNSNKDELVNSQKDYLQYEFSVGDQVNVKQYEVEVSLTGNTEKSEDWTTAGILMTNTGGLTHDYTMKVDVTRWFEKSKIIYSRIKSVDLDGKVMYSRVETSRY